MTWLWATLLGYALAMPLILGVWWMFAGRRLWPGALLLATGVAGWAVALGWLMA